MALHDRPDGMRAALPGAVADASAREGVRPVALAFGLCGPGTSGLRAAGVPLVVPGSRDGVFLLLGPKERHVEQQRSCPSC